MMRSENMACIEGSVSTHLIFELSPHRLLASGKYVLYPPNTHCVNSSCTNTAPLKDVEQRSVVLFTLADGVQPAWSIHLSCPSELTSDILVQPHDSFLIE